MPEFERVWGKIHNLVRTGGNSCHTLNKSGNAGSSPAGRIMLFHISKPIHITDGDDKGHTTHIILIVDANEEQLHEIKATLELMVIKHEMARRDY